MPPASKGPLDESSVPWTGTVTHEPPPPARRDAATLAGRTGVTLVDADAGGGARLASGGGTGTPGGGGGTGTAGGGAGAGTGATSSSGATALGQAMAERTDIDPRRDAYPGYRLRPGMRFGPCTILSPLGRGGMGEVWLAKNDAENRDEAVKVLLDSNAREDELRRFIREAQASMSLSDAREVVRTYAIDVAEGLLYIRMELVRGKALDAWTPRDGKELFQVLKRMASALAVGHRRRLVHRDVKPSNYMLRDDGSVKLMDFGLARPLGVSTLTATAAMMGTPAYMSPEQWVDARSVDMRADVYSLGVAFYALLARRLPYDPASCATPQAYHLKILNEDPPRPALLPGAPAELPNLILTAMAKRPGERFADAVELLHALERIERDATYRIEPPATEASRARGALVRRAGAVALAILLTAGATGLGVSLVMGRGGGSAGTAGSASSAGSDTSPAAATAGRAPAGDAPAPAGSAAPGSTASSPATEPLSPGAKPALAAIDRTEPLSPGAKPALAAIDRDAVRAAALSSRAGYFLKAARAAEAATPMRLSEAIRAYRGFVSEFFLLSPEEASVYEEALGVRLSDVRARLDALRAVEVGDAVERASTPPAAPSAPVASSTAGSSGGAPPPPAPQGGEPGSGPYGPPPGGPGPGGGRPPPPPPPGGGRPPPGGGRPPR